MHNPSPPARPDGAPTPSATVSVPTAPHPDFVTIVNRATIARPIDEAWARISGFFDLGSFLDVECQRLSGDGGLGSVRRINETILEPMVGESRHSYTYAQTQGPMSPHAYHGCVACEPDGAERTELTYTLVYDQAGIAPERRQPERERLSMRFAGAVSAMRRVAEAY